MRLLIREIAAPPALALGYPAPTSHPTEDTLPSTPLNMENSVCTEVSIGAKVSEMWPTLVASVVKAWLVMPW